MQLFAGFGVLVKGSFGSNPLFSERSNQYEIFRKYSLVFVRRIMDGARLAFGRTAVVYYYRRNTNRRYNALNLPALPFSPSERSFCMRAARPRCCSICCGLSSAAWNLPLPARCTDCCSASLLSVFRSGRSALRLPALRSPRSAPMLRSLLRFSPHFLQNKNDPQSALKIKESLRIVLQDNNIIRPILKILPC